MSSNEGANKSTEPKTHYTSFKPVFECKQVDNNNLEFWKLDAVYTFVQ